MSDKKLNKEQLEAISHGDGPLLIIAGAGTGKTTVITERIKHLISEKLAKPEEILALTFTEKASSEMRERIDLAMPYGYTQMWVMTFHSFCDAIARDEGLEVGIDTSFKLMSETDVIALFKSHIYEFDLDYFRPLGNPNKFISGLLQHFSRLADEDISIEEYLSWSDKFTGDLLEKQKWQELARVYKQWQELKTKNSVMEFGDLIKTAIDIFRTRPNILEKYLDKFKYVLVDEFQDTNYAQNQLVNLLSGDRKNLTVVADDDQAIYRWRGAAISNVIQFRKTYPSAKLVVLTKNYRSSQLILDSAYGLIQNNNPDRLEVAEGIDKKLVTVRKTPGQPIELLHANTVAQEAEMVVAQIQKIKSKNQDLNYKDFAILVRANSHAEPFIKALDQAGIPQQFLGPGQLFMQPEVKDLIAYLQLVRNFSDDTAFFRVASMPIWDIGGRDIVELSVLVKNEHVSLFEAAEKSNNEQVKKLTSILQKHINVSTTATAGKILYEMLQESGILQTMVNYQDAADEQKAANISKLFSKLKDFESTHEDATVRAMMEWIDLAMQLGESPAASGIDWSVNDAVNILTVHSSKGLEFPVVFVVNLVTLRFPSTEKKEPIPIPDELIKEDSPTGDMHTQEERRLFYVAMTRAKDQLFFTAADSYGDGKRLKKLSPFVIEVLGDQALNAGKQSAGIQPSLLDWQPIDKPKIVIKNSVKIDYLSYSQIQTFLTCPLHYKAKYILKIPTPTSAAQSFGSSIHLALDQFYKDPEQGLIPLLEREWIRQGYESKEQEALYLAKGKKILNEYLDAQYQPKIKTIMLEQKFILPLRLQDRFLKVGGKIDRVDELPDGGIEIIDYKTGAKVPSQKDIDEDLQMSFYALAASMLNSKPFPMDPEKIKLSLYYFDEQKFISTTRSKDQLQAAIEEIFAVAEQIETSDFKCSGSRLCQDCEFKMICDIKTTS